jgi:integrase
MATIYARGDRWYLNWSESGIQHRRSLGAITAREASVQRHAKELELLTGERLFAPSAPFAEHLARYLDWHRTEYPDSHYRVAQIAAQHFGPFVGMGLSQISAFDIERWKAERMGRVSHETVTKELRTLKAVLEKAVEWGELQKNPAAYVEAPRSLNSEPVHWYSRNELEPLYGCRHGATWRLLANTGLRRGEAQQLRWARVDLERGELRIVSTAEARTKSGKWRLIPLSGAAHAALQALRARTDSEHVLPQLTRESLSRAFLVDAERLGLPGSLHSLRHTYAAHLVMAAVPLRTVQVLMGHASFKTTERYAHLAPEHLRDQALRISL